MKIIRVSKKKIAMPKRQAKRLVAMPWPENIDIPDKVKKDQPHLEDMFEEQIIFNEGGPKATWKGSGGFGMAGGIGDGKVEKVTFDIAEYKEALKIIECQKKSGGSLPCVVHIYSAEETEENYRIIAEEVRVLNAKEERLMDSALDVAEFYGQMLITKKFKVDENFHMITEDIIKAGIRSYGETYYVSGEDDGRPLTNVIFSCLMKMVEISKCLRYNGLWMNDFHPGNFGIRGDGSLVVLDVGMK